mmetsp:Transcript_7982/g.20695  ORF Transcript_7982/g.20695 Transcript_7982/m.20695 type:complete len:192 (+) Transcript_7982:62-637(+)
MASRSRVVGLYRKALRSARRCPDPKQRETILHYVRGSFAGVKTETDPRRIARLVAEAEEQVSHFDYLHDLREGSMKKTSPPRPVAVEAASTTTTVHHRRRRRPSEAIRAAVERYAKGREIAIDFCDWDVDELRGFEAKDAVDLLDLPPLQAVRLAAKIRGVLRLAGSASSLGRHADRGDDEPDDEATPPDS